MDHQLNENSEITQNSLIMKLDISDIVLTPLTCASLINEMLKGLQYQKSQIPYPYSWMKMMVDKKRKHSDNGGPYHGVNLSAANYFHVVSSAYDTLESVMLAITREFRECVNNIKEVTFLFGATPQCPKEIFTIYISCLTKSHVERNHAADLGRYQMRILRRLFLSKEWLAHVSSSYSCTNTYVYLKKDIIGSEDCCKSQTDFVPAKPLTFSSKMKHVQIYFEPDNEAVPSNCCENLTIFEDENHSINHQQKTCINIGECEKNIVWYQYRDLIKGFKDCFINKESASKLW
ncbi:unnamed protein product [Phaedon cochleariae]|uniref:Uncharacterized protein n=1 Tax=Phaedon cochleariae TaxID=80249 RepID=A0A9P0GUB5_PHACE|nr:unnamed protein product [Phaedon cochleariae]